MFEWSHLPNAEHIDWVLQSVKDDPDAWEEAWDSALDAVATVAARAAWDAAWDAARVTELNAARGAILALVAYDDCGKYLNMSYEELLLWGKLDPHPACTLLLPYVYVKEIQE